MKQRFLNLDVMRGIAALAVVYYHTNLMYNGSGASRGYLAVDLFFVLSGFVIAFRYDGDFARGMPVSHFMFMRLARLVPMMLIGSALGALSVSELPFYDRLLSIPLNSLGLPGLPIGGELVPANPPFWSLFFELWIANLAFACLWQRLHGSALYAVIVTSALILIAVRDFNTGYSYEFLVFSAGIPRVLFSFFAGVALSRLRQHYRPPPIPASVCAAAVLATIFLPGIREIGSICILLVVFPALVLMGSTQVERRPWLGAAVGEASYALYAIHLPILTMLQPVLMAHGWMTMSHNAHRALQVLIVLALTAFAYLLDKWPDRQLQRWLRGFIPNNAAGHGNAHL